MWQAYAHLFSLFHMFLFILSPDCRPDILTYFKQEKLKGSQDAERDKRAAAAERRIAAAAALRAQGTGSVVSSSQSNTETSDSLCTCCHVSLAGIVPFHRYNYKYCSASCMHVHKEILEDG